MKKISITEFYGIVIENKIDWVKKTVQDLNRKKVIVKMTYYKLGFRNFDSILFEFKNDNRPELWWINNAWSQKFFGPAAKGNGIKHHTNERDPIAEIIFGQVNPPITTIEYKVIIPDVNIDKFKKLSDVLTTNNIDFYIEETLID